MHYGYGYTFEMRWKDQSWYILRAHLNTIRFKPGKVSTNLGKGNNCVFKNRLGACCTERTERWEFDWNFASQSTGQFGRSVKLITGKLQLILIATSQLQILCSTAFLLTNIFGIDLFGKLNMNFVRKTCFYTNFPKDFLENNLFCLNNSRKVLHWSQKKAKF